MYALIDCNNFYASCERVFNPNLNNKPVVILSNNDGCVIARSNEAKALLIPMGAPAFQFEKIFEKHNVNVFSSNYTLYGDLSSRVMNILSRFTPDIEIYSIDEAFLVFDGFDEHFNLEDYALNILNTVKRSTGIPISIGIAPTKSLAKVANKIAKKFPSRTKGVYVINTEEKRIKALKWTKIGDVWGIGRQHERKLLNIKIDNAYKFTELPNQYVKQEMSIVGLRLKRDLSGYSTLHIEETSIKKNIAVTRAFENMYSDYDEVRERVSSYAVRIGEKLRKQKSCCSMLYIFLITNQFRQDLRQYRGNIVCHTPFPTNSTIELIKTALNGLDRIYRKGYQYKKAGIIAINLTPAKERQLGLFTNENPKHNVLMNLVDRLNKSENGKIKFGSQDLGRTWKMKQEKLSNRFTTRIDEIINIKI